MYSLFTRLINMSLVAGIMVLVILVLRLLLKKAPKKFICLLWALVALRLIFPFSFSSSLSAFNLLDFDTNENGQVEYFQYNGKTEKPKLSFSYPGLVNDNLSPDSMTVGTRTSDVYLPPFVYVWAFGVCVMSAHAAISWLKLRSETSASVKSSGNIYVCDDIDSPFILGIVSPRIYLPSGMDEAAKKSVIAHEKAHLRRRDHWWKPLGYLLLSVYWFNPFLWLAYALLCRDIEAACDEKVIENMDKESISSYSEALLSCAVSRRMITACPVAFGETDVKGRIKNVLNYRKPAFWIVCLTVILCIGAAVCLLTDPAKKNDEEAVDSVYDPLEKNDEGAAESVYYDGNGKAYKYQLTLTERVPDMDGGITYTVLTDDPDLGVDRIREAMFSSSMTVTGFSVIDTDSFSDASWVWPCDSTTVSSPFAERVYPVTGETLFHDEVDIAAEKGSSVYCAFPGEVVAAEYDSKLGNYVKILHLTDTNHPGEIYTCYSHLDRLDVGVGEVVYSGNAIGTVGSTGLSTGPHLAFSVTVDGEAVDPMDFFESDK